MTALASPFVAGFPAPPCPECRQRVERGDEVQYAPRGWPTIPMSPSAKTVLWHTSCVWMAENASRCSVCGAREDEGACLL